MPYQQKSHPKGDFFVGGLEGIRTLDPHNANVVRSQLRYKPMYPSIILPKQSLVKGKTWTQGAVFFPW